MKTNLKRLIWQTYQNQTQNALLQNLRGTGLDRSPLLLKLRAVSLKQTRMSTQRQTTPSQKFCCFQKVPEHQFSKIFPANCFCCIFLLYKVWYKLFLGPRPALSTCPSVRPSVLTLLFRICPLLLHVVRVLQYIKEMKPIFKKSFYFALIQ